MNDIPTANIDITHHLQRQILLQLRQNGVQTYRQLKPEGVEGNAYNYHLKNLKKSGLVRAVNGGYELSETGRADRRLPGHAKRGAGRRFFAPVSQSRVNHRLGGSVILMI